MPTYGSLETANDFPINPDLEENLRKMTILLRERNTIIEACEHHFVPGENALLGLRGTRVSGVYNAGELRDLDETSSDIYFLLKCSKCCVVRPTPIAKRCPICAEETKGEWGDPDDLKKYFGDINFLYYGLWLISCANSHCEFKAAGRLWDQ